MSALSRAAGCPTPCSSPSIPGSLSPGRVIEVDARGDFEGVWQATFHPAPAGTRVELVWVVTVHKPLLRCLGWLLRPLFAWNHRWTTPIGEAGLIAYLTAQRGVSRRQAG